MVTPEPKWANQIIKYVKDRELPKNWDETRKVRVKASQYLLLNNTLNKRSFTLPYYDAYPIKKPAMLSERYTREYMGTTWGIRH